MTGSNAQKRQAHELVDRFATARDRFRVKSHLLGMEAKDTLDSLDEYFSKVEGRIKVFIDKASEKADESKLQGHLALLEAKERLQEVAEDVQKAVRAMDKSSDKAHTEFDRARVHAHLARLEAKDYWSKRNEEWQRKLAGKSLNEGNRDALNSIDDFVNRMHEWLPR